MTVFLYCFREREQVLRLFERVSGVRMMTSYFRVGGLARPLYPEFEEEVRAFIDAFPDRVDEYETLLTENPIFKKRTVGVGVFTADEAIDLGLSGPNLRACGVAHDLRKAQPYSGYERFEFDVPTREGGDVYDRYRVRVAEMRESAKIVRQALDGLPDGPVLAHAPKVVVPDDVAEHRPPLGQWQRENHRRHRQRMASSSCRNRRWELGDSPPRRCSLDTSPLPRN